MTSGERTVFVIDGGAGRAVSAIPALLKYQFKNPQDDFKICVYGWDSLLWGIPEIQDRVFKLREREKDMVTDRLKSMTDEEREKKHELLTKIANLVRVASALGDDIDDEQTRFISETMKLVMIAGSDPDTSIILGNHIINYLEDMSMIKGEKTAVDYLTKDYKLQLN